MKLKFTEAKEDLLRLDLGTGKGLKKPEGFIGIDIVPWKGVKVVTDLRNKWPWKNSTVDEVNADYLIQYLTSQERVHFFNELYRVLKPGGKASIIAPHFAASKAYADPRTFYPPISEWLFPMLNKGWREAQNSVDTTGLTCDFDHVVGVGDHPMLATRNQEYINHARAFWKEAIQDIAATLTSRKQ